MSAGSKRLGAAARAGIPAMVAPGCRCGQLLGTRIDPRVVSRAPFLPPQPQRDSDANDTLGKPGTGSWPRGTAQCVRMAGGGLPAAPGNLSHLRAGPAVWRGPAGSPKCSGSRRRVRNRSILIDASLPARVKAIGFSEVQNFPTVGLIDGLFRQNPWKTGMTFSKEVKITGIAHGLDLLTTPTYSVPTKLSRWPEREPSFWSPTWV